MILINNLLDNTIKEYMDNEHNELKRIIFSCKKFLSHTIPKKDK